MVVDAEVMLKPHHRGGGGIGGDDPAPASIPQGAMAVERGGEKLPEPEREQSHGRGCSAGASAAAAAAIGGDKKGGARARPWRSCGGGRAAARSRACVNFLWRRTAATLASAMQQWGSAAETGAGLGRSAAEARAGERDAQQSNSESHVVAKPLHPISVKVAKATISQNSGAANLLRFHSQDLSQK